MKATIIAGASLALILSAGAAHAEQKPDLPGTAWNSTGILSPAEKGNLISQTYAEQGIKVNLTESLALVPYGSLGATFDSEGYDWNNRIGAAAGVKLVQSLPNGIVAVRGGYMVEHRLKSDLDEGSAFAQAEYWFGWDGAGTYPGSSWGAVTYNTPFEQGNTLGVLYVQQGYRAHRDDDWSLVPFVEATLSKDTEGYDWNNYLRGAVGAKAVINGCGCEVGLAYAHEERFESDTTEDGLIAFIRFSFGWNLR